MCFDSTMHSDSSPFFLPEGSIKPRFFIPILQNLDSSRWRRFIYLYSYDLHSGVSIFSNDFGNSKILALFLPILAKIHNSIPQEYAIFYTVCLLFIHYQGNFQFNFIFYILRFHEYNFLCICSVVHSYNDKCSKNVPFEISSRIETSNLHFLANSDCIECENCEFENLIFGIISFFSQIQTSLLSYNFFKSIKALILFSRMFDVFSVPVIIQISYLTCNRQNVITLLASFKGKQLIKELITPEVTTRVSPDPRRHMI
ncbi:Protein CBG15915 [Caenorhabditis briggsae]|uniref:Protein CBG15915 n=1 Tax=Caenorhabditis briggsae TaxID=6238 RepID=A8XN25_CAEBR|nr:Protein CBG15915 [Caenorhabditis briggsae]CAP34051.2 Protein CBG15915 [Caenorhabditis briggsae]